MGGVEVALLRRNRVWFLLRERGRGQREGEDEQEESEPLHAFASPPKY